MPTSTVKHVSGPPQPRKIEPARPFVFKPLMESAKRNSSRLAARTALFTVCGFLILANLSSAKAQTLRAQISVFSVAPARIKIDVEFPTATNILSFRNAYGGVLGLGERIEMLEAINGSGESIRVQKLAPGEFQTAEKFAHFRYEVNGAEPSRPAQMSHVSWVNRDQGLLMLADLLPPATKDSGNFSAALITVDVPAGWTVASNVKKEGLQFSTDDPENAVFLIGPAVKEKSQPLDANKLSIITSGKWPFSDKDAIRLRGK
jgi:hypothetical protein